MADYAITGRKGTGKSLFAIGVIRDALRQGKRVASNLNVHLDQLLSSYSKMPYVRLPDRPNAGDLEAIGRGQDGVIEDDNGIIVLDETSTFFNSRAFGDKARQPLLDWLVHSRKLGWDVYYICQGLEQIDKQLRTTMIEYHIVVKRTDKWPIPFITPLCRTIGLNVRFPKFHIGIIKYGIERDALLIERRWYRGKELYPAYDTQQLFLDRDHPQSVGLHSQLSAWHVRGRYLGWWAMNKHILVSGGLMGLAVGLAVGGFSGYRFAQDKHKISESLVDTSIKATGTMQDGAKTLVLLSDGRILPSTGHRLDTGNVDVYQVAGKWIKVTP